MVGIVVVTDTGHGGGGGDEEHNSEGKNEALMVVMEAGRVLDSVLADLPVGYV